MKAAVAVNRELILLYWHIGREILRAQKAEGWGAKVVERLGAPAEGGPARHATQSIARSAALPPRASGSPAAPPPAAKT